MIKNLIGGALMFLFILGGAVAADALKPGAKLFFPSGAQDHADGEKAGDEHAEPDHGKKAAKDDHAEEDDGHEADAKKDDGHGAKGGHGEPAPKAGGSMYYKFSRQFIVPVVDGSSIDSLVILDLNLEIEPGLSEDAYALEPKIRDSLMTELLALSNEGRFESRLTDPANYAEIRARLLAAARVVMPKGVKEVLILDMARQDQ